MKKQEKELTRKKLCFSCQESWVPGHKCAGKDKIGKTHYIEFYSDSDNDDEEEQQEQEHGHRTSGEETS